MSSETDQASKGKLEAKYRDRAYLGAFGVIFTSTYLLGIVYFLWGRQAELSNLELNALGDFSAGVLGPLAILWLVIGFFQQKAGLHHSAEALMLQNKELNNSVKQQSKLVDAASDELDFEREKFDKTIQELLEAKRPKFVVSYRGIKQDIDYARNFDGPLTHQIDFANIGGTACEVGVWLGYGIIEPEEDLPVVIWKQYEVRSLTVNLFASDSHGDGIELILNYTDAMGKYHDERYGFNRLTHGVYPQFEIRRESGEAPPYTSIVGAASAQRTLA